MMIEFTIHHARINRITDNGEEISPFEWHINMFDADKKPMVRRWLKQSKNIDYWLRSTLGPENEKWISHRGGWSFTQEEFAVIFVLTWTI